MAKITKIKKEFHGRYLILGILTAFFSIIGALSLSLALAAGTWSDPESGPTEYMPDGPVWLQELGATLQNGYIKITGAGFGGNAPDVGYDISSTSAVIKGSGLGTTIKDGIITTDSDLKIKGGRLGIGTDGTNFGTSGQVLSSTGTGLNWTNPNTLISSYYPTYGTDCSTGYYVYGINSDGTLDCRADTAGSSGLTSVSTDGITLSGNGTSSSPLSVTSGYFQRRVSGECAAGSSIRVINSDGTVTCESDDVGSGSSYTPPSGTSGQTLRYNSSNTLEASSLLYNNGTNVGIGTITPASKLSVYVNSAGNPSLTADTNQITNFQSGSAVQLASGVITTDPWTFWFQTKRSSNNGQSYPLALNPLGGNVGIGTTSPSTNLDVSGGVRIRGTLYDKDNEAGTAGQVLSSVDSGAVDWIDLPSGVTYVPPFVVGKIITPSNGSQGGYVGINTSCAGAISGSHLCTTNEVLNTINQNRSYTLSDGYYWVSGGVDFPAVGVSISDCNGWTSDSVDAGAIVWLVEGGALKRTYISPCSYANNFLCCK